MHKQTRGFTLIEVVVAMAIVGIMTVSLSGAYGQTTRAKRFTNSVRLYANTLQEAKIDALTVNNNLDCSHPTACYWRGRVVEVDAVSDTISVYALYGRDTTRLVNPLFSSGPFSGLETKQLIEMYSLGPDSGMAIDSINYNGSSTPRVSIAFIAPTAIPRTADTVYPLSFGLSEPYDEQAQIEITLSGDGTDLTGYIDYSAIRDTIGTRAE